MVKGDHIDLTFLSGKRPLTKQISKTNTIPYPNLRDLTSAVEPVDNILSFATALQSHAGNGEALLVGTLVRQIKQESRAGLTDKTQLSRWLCLDFDGLPGYSPKSAVKELEIICPDISKTSHIIQYSASSRLFKNTELRCHLFFMLDEPISPLALKNWFINANLATKFSQFITLTPAGVGLHYPVDPALSEQSRLIFIASPVFSPPSMDPHPDDRLQYVDLKFSELNVASMSAAQPEFNQLQNNLVDTAKKLRKKAGLGGKKMQTAFKNNFCSNPDPCEVTGIKKERSYVYLNLNDGDSWGYYYPENDPSILYNFKGEPDYPLEKIVPDYWTMYVAPITGSRNPSGPGTLHFVFQDDHSGKTHSCIYNSNTAQLDISAALSDTAARRWLSSHKQNPKFFHVVSTFYDPRPVAILGVDLRMRTINTYQPTTLKPIEKITHSVPDTIDIIIRHVLNQPDTDPVVSREYEHFLNWLAFILQTKERTGTAWLFHGTTGTGKGVLLHNILRPLVGKSNFSIINMKTMAEKFTDRIDQKLIVGLDEIKRGDFQRHPGLMNQIKNIITEETVTSRRFQGAPREADNYANYIMTSNEQVPMAIPADDRRFNVALGQPRPLRVKFNNSEEKTNQAVALKVPTELPRFYRFLLDRKVRRGLVSLSIDNKAKRNMVAAGRTATQSFFDLIRMGEINEFCEERRRLENKESAITTIMENATIISHDTIEKYKEFCDEYFTIKTNGAIAITREQMSTLARIMLGKKIPMTPQRYMSWLAQFGIAETSFICSVHNRETKGVRMECQKKVSSKPLSM
jgi:hypothetical protein